eukprot:TRINITY_DN65818_c9_g3_i1.p1 TRINITY_DN65818_c9_g3~~TRINITY_DN65818_c9_g3_i1.p1  ORF type:complete len:274 (-),score=182.08 TRINITY_DN65818_c9_g3_i1:935-1756(-)
MSAVKKTTKTAEEAFEENQKKFEELTKGDLGDQAEYFLKSFIFDLGDQWKVVSELQSEFRKALADSGEGEPDLNPVMAADFLQKHGRERTALERKEEVSDIDLDNNGRIALLEYLLLHFKVMVLTAYFKRVEKDCPYDLTQGGRGVTGVGPLLLAELFTLPIGLDPELEAAIEAFTAQKRAREEKLSALEEKAAKGGVKGMAAKNEIKQLESQDLTDMNRIEITLNAAKRRSAKSSGDVALAKKKKAEEDAKKAALEAGRNKLKAKAALWENK